MVNIPDAPDIRCAERTGYAPWNQYMECEDEYEDEDDEEDSFTKYNERLVQFEKEKRKLPKNLTPQEYEERVKKLARRWRI